MTLQNIRQLKNEIRIPKVMGKVVFNSNMSSRTWLKAGGEAKVFYSLAQLLTTLQSQKNIATNRNNYLLNEQKLIKKEIVINNIKKIKAEEKTSEYKTLYSQELEKKSYN